MYETHLRYLLCPSQQAALKEETSAASSNYCIISGDRTVIVAMVDSGLIVVVCITSSLIVIVFSLLLYVEYEWCHVFFNNNTVSMFFSFWVTDFFSLSSFGVLNVKGLIRGLKG